MFEFKSPLYWKEMRKIRKEFEEQAARNKQQAVEETVPHNDIEEAQASSNEELEGLKKYVREKKKPI
tara:strand:- start:135 stop:335 length:201 start_codon:yes stop_codon:yes gene_type:complete